jgi:hypothetical protein
MGRDFVRRAGAHRRPDPGDGGIVGGTRPGGVRLAQRIELRQLIGAPARVAHLNAGR